MKLGFNFSRSNSQASYSTTTQSPVTDSEGRVVEMPNVGKELVSADGMILNRALDMLQNLIAMVFQSERAGQQNYNGRRRKMNNARSN
jgi:hypothetical protein